jgi:hypothetical protein
MIRYLTQLRAAHARKCLARRPANYDVKGKGLVA